MTNKYIAFLFVSIFIFASCAKEESTSVEDYHSTQVNLVNKGFNEYWFNGEAELSSYKLSQARYGEVHEGEAVMVFVTEPFSKLKQVKLDNVGSSGSDKIDVMKHNFSKKFYTGIYPYSMMMSTFTPVDRKANNRTLKVSTSSQEWCGHTFTQYNLEKNSYDIRQYSYFESEGDLKTKLPSAFLEDEIWNIIRIDPTLLPTGKFKIIPGSFFGRLRHTQFQQVNASAQLVEISESGLMEYQITFDRPERSLNIRFTKDFPYAIEGWDETFKSGFGADAKTLTTNAKINKRLKLDYWNKHSVEDKKYREALGLQ